MTAAQVDLLKANFERIKSSIPENVELIAVSKTRSVEEIKALYDLGQRKFGENKVQELTEKQPQLPADIQWHLIGHLQRNKVKYIAGFIDTIESVDSLKLLHEIEKEATKAARKIKILLQLKIAREESKFGLSVEEVRQIVLLFVEGKFPHCELEGLMGMATFTDDCAQIAGEFKFLSEIFAEFSKIIPLQTLSMGMSDDYPVAIDCGSTSVRIGSALFGKR